MLFHDGQIEAEAPIKKWILEKEGPIDPQSATILRGGVVSNPHAFRLRRMSTFTLTQSLKLERLEPKEEKPRGCGLTLQLIPLNKTVP